MALRIHSGGTPTMQLLGNPIAASTLSPEDQATAEELFEEFCSANSLKNITSLFQKFCECIKLRPNDYRTFYTRLKERMSFSWKWKSFQGKMDKRASQKEYGQGKPCSGNKVLVIGAGPCGLRTAIETALLGAKVVVLEKRDRFARNNVLHLWPFVITDLRNLGAKKFYPKFCGGSVDHISIRILQCILLKVALLLGVEVHYGVSFLNYIEPSPDSSNHYLGWRAELLPPGHELSNYEFDVLIGADGRRSNLQGFQRKVFRGKLAIAITANFINRNTIAEQAVPEISGVARIYNQQFFQDLYQSAGIDLENIVYYKDATHYFVMTAKKSSLFAKNVLNKDFSDSDSLLDRSNINREKLGLYALEAAQFSTNNLLTDLEFAIDLHGDPDVSVFDFTNMYAADNASRIIEKRGHRLLICLVGDSLLEPFWPLGTGCAHGFLAVFDAAWMIRHWGLGHRTPLQMIVEREALYRILPSTKSEYLCKNATMYSIDPQTRYPHVDFTKAKVENVRHLYDTDSESVDFAELTYSKRIATTGTTPKRMRTGAVSDDVLMSWLREQLHSYNLEMKTLFDFVRQSLPLAALIHRFRPELIDYNALTLENEHQNWQLVIVVVADQLGIYLPFTLDQIMQSPENIGSESISALVGQLYELFRREKPGQFVAKMPMDTSPLENHQLKEERRRAIFAKPISPIGSSKKRPNLYNENAKRRRPSHKRRESLQQANINMGEKIRFLENAFKPAPTAKTTFLSRHNGNENYNSDQIDQVRQELRLNGMAGLYNQFPANLIKIAVFQDKKQEMLTKLTEDTIAETKYTHLDEKIKQCEIQMREGNMRGAQNVAELAEDYAVVNQARKENSNVSPPGNSARPPMVLNVTPSHQRCYFCGKQVYLAERKSVEGLFFHRVCFRCNYCNKVMQLNGDYTFDRYDPSGGKFYCLAHVKYRKHDIALMTSPQRETPPKTPTGNTIFSFTRYPSREDVLRSPSPSAVASPCHLYEEDEDDKRNVLDDELVLTHNFGGTTTTVLDDISTTDSESESVEELVNHDNFDDPETAVENWRMRRLSLETKELVPVRKYEDFEQVLPNTYDAKEDSEYLRNAYDEDQSSCSASTYYSDSSSDDEDGIDVTMVEASPHLLPSAPPITEFCENFPPTKIQVVSEPKTNCQIYSVNGSRYLVEDISGGNHRIKLQQPTVTPVDYNSVSRNPSSETASSTQNRRATPPDDDVFLTPSSSSKSTPTRLINWDPKVLETARKLKELRLSGSSSPPHESSNSDDVFFTPKTSFPESRPEALIFAKSQDDSWSNVRLDFEEGWTITVPRSPPVITPQTREALKLQVRNMTVEKRAAAREKARLKSDAELGIASGFVRKNRNASDTSPGSSSSEGSEGSKTFKSVCIVDSIVPTSANGKTNSTVELTTSPNVELESGFLKRATQVAEKYHKLETTKLLHRAQETQRLTEETEAQLVELDHKLSEIECSMRRASTDDDSEEAFQKEWFEVSEEKKRVQNQLSELKLMAENLRLEDRQRICQEELRKLMAMDDSCRSEMKKDEERTILDEILQIRKLRDKVNEQLSACQTSAKTGNTR